MTRFRAWAARHPGVAAALGLLLLGLAHLHPFPWHAGTMHPGPSPDVQELIWRLLWGAHALITPGVSLNDANTFFPEDGTYATMDYAVGLSVLALPIRAFTDNPLLVYNLTCFVSLAISAAGAYWLAYKLTGNRGAALVAAAIFAFNPIRLGRLGQINILGVHWLPFLLLASHRLFEKPARRTMTAVALTLFLAITTGGYQAVFAAGVLAWATMTLAVAKGRGAMRPMMLTALAIGIAGLAFVPVGKPYVDAAAGSKRVRTLGDVERGSPRVADLAFLNSVTHGEVRKIFDPEDHFGAEARAVLMPGLVPWGLAALGAYALARRRGRRSQLALYGSLAAAGFLLSLGLNLPGYVRLFELLPPLRMVRAPSRFALVGLLGLAMLAAAGVTWLVARLGARRAAWLAPVLLVAHLAEVYRPMGIDGYQYDPPPPVYEWLAEQPGDFGIVELPGNWDLNTFYLVYSTYHWKRLVNGYNGSFISPYHQELIFRVLPEFPRKSVLRRLEEILGLRYVVLHHDPDETKMRRRGRWHARQQLVEALEDLPPRLHVVWQDEGHTVVEIVPPAAGWIGQRVRRMAGTRALDGKRLSFEARSLPAPVAITRHEAVVLLDGVEIERIALTSNFERFEVQLPAGLEAAPGPHRLVIASHAPLDRERLPEELDLEIGRTGADFDEWVQVASAGPRSGNRVSIRINGAEEASKRRGYNLVTIEAKTGRILHRECFDTWDTREEADRMAARLEGLPDGTVVVLASRDQASRNFTDRAVRALRGIGSRVDPRQGPVDSHTLIGVKGAAPRSGFEHWSLAEAVRIEHGDPRMLAEIAVREITVDD